MWSYRPPAGGSLNFPSIDVRHLLSEWPETAPVTRFDSKFSQSFSSLLLNRCWRLDAQQQHRVVPWEISCSLPLRHDLREGTLGIIRAIGDNQGPLQVVRLENTTDAGLEFEAARQAETAVSTRKQWVEVGLL